MAKKVAQAPNSTNQLSTLTLSNVGSMMNFFKFSNLVGSTTVGAIHTQDETAKDVASPAPFLLQRTAPRGPVSSLSEHRISLIYHIIVLYDACFSRPNSYHKKDSKYSIIFIYIYLYSFVFVLPPY